MATEKLTLASAANSLWNQSDPSGLDNTTDFPSDPMPSASVVFNANDDNEDQIWNLSSVTEDFEDSSITATLFIFGTNQDTDSTIQAALKVGGSFGADQPIVLDLGEAGWKSIELGSNLSVADFSGAQLRLTTGSTTGTEAFEAIYVLLEGDIDTDTGTSTVPGVEIVTLNLSDGFVNIAYSQNITAQNGTTPYSWEVAAGSLPPGLSINASGTPSTVLSGTPTTEGQYFFTIRVTDDNADTDTQEYIVNIAADPGELTIVPRDLPHGCVGESYSEIVESVGGVGPWMWLVTTGSSFPPGLSVSQVGFGDDVDVNGTPTVAGIYNFTLQVTDNTSDIDTEDFTIRIYETCPPLLRVNKGLVSSHLINGGRATI